MRVLLCTHHYLEFSGSETFAYTLANALLARDCEVHLFSPYAEGELVRLTRGHGVPVFTDWEEVKRNVYDVVQVSHNLIALEARYHFPAAPLVYLSHGVLPFLEQPPFLECNCTRWLAVSEEVRDNLVARGVPEARITIFRNPVDTDRFCPYEPIGESPQTLLLMSGRIDPETLSVIESAAQKLDLKLLRLGGSRTPDPYPEKYINRADICISLGRGILEAMACARAALVLDCHGGDGFVTPQNIGEIMKCNFSGRRFKKRYTVDALAAELSAYHSSMGAANRALVETSFSAQRQAEALLQIFSQAMAEHEPKPVAHLEPFVFSLRETRHYTRFSALAHAQRVLDHQAQVLQACDRQWQDKLKATEDQRDQVQRQLNQMVSSKAWRLLTLYYRLRHRLGRFLARLTGRQA